MPRDPTARTACWTHDVLAAGRLMPSFCRHGRFEATCPVCARTAKPAGPAPARRSPARTATTTTPRTRTSRRASADVTVRRLARSEDDGYQHELIPGVRATQDARRLGEAIATATGRLHALRTAPPGRYADAAAAATAGDVGAAATIAFTIAVVSPAAGEDPWRTIDIALADPAAPLDPDGLGPRAAPDPGRALAAFPGWLERSGGLAARDALPADRRFDRLYERLGLPGVGRAQRYEFLVLAGCLGIADVEPRTLRLGERDDDATLAAKRVFAIGEDLLLAERAAALAAELHAPIAALDLALADWGRLPDDPPITTAVDAEPDAGVRAAAADVLGV